MNIPLICTLSDGALLERRETLFVGLRQQVEETIAVENGYRLRFPAAALRAVLTLIELESDCCQFLTFRLTVEPAHGPLWLEISGPTAEASGIILAELGI
ncbi:MAG: hypothetical protein MUD01_13210 [Chloroflexaceae bacterium]|jgi:hypothetical protein|nr:hypothetical protein [Chloroflexaceae bacterium]